MAAESNRGEQKPNLSVSCGKAFGRQPLALDALMRTADKHMYDAKRKKKQHRRKAGKPERS